MKNTTTEIQTALNRCRKLQEVFCVSSTAYNKAVANSKKERVNESFHMAEWGKDPSTTISLRVSKARDAAECADRDAQYYEKRMRIDRRAMETAYTTLGRLVAHNGLPSESIDPS